MPPINEPARLFLPSINEKAVSVQAHTRKLVAASFQLKYFLQNGWI
jgi:hypothetical protein